MRKHTISNVAACVKTNDDDAVCGEIIVAAAAALKHHLRKHKQTKKIGSRGLRRDDRSSDIRLRRWLLLLLLLPARSFKRTESAGERVDAVAAAGRAVPVAGSFVSESEAVREARSDEDGDNDIGARSEPLDAWM